MNRNEGLLRLQESGLLALGLNLEGIDDQAVTPLSTKPYLNVVLKNAKVTLSISVFESGANVYFESTERILELEPSEYATKNRKQVPMFSLTEYLVQIKKMQKSEVERTLNKADQETVAEYHLRVFVTIRTLIETHLMPVIEGKEWPETHFDWGEYK